MGVVEDANDEAKTGVRLSGHEQKTNTGQFVFKLRPRTVFVLPNDIHSSDLQEGCMHLDYEDFKKAMAVAEGKLKDWKEKYGKMKPYLVINTPSRQQISFTDDPLAILQESQDMIMDDDHRRKALVLMDDIEAAKKAKDDNRGKAGQGNEAATAAKKAKNDQLITALNEDLNAVSNKLKVNGDGLVELRFSNLKYDLLWQLKKEPAVCQIHTNPSDAYIRVVLGTVQSMLS